MPPEEPTMALSAEGYTDLPPGKIAAVVTFLEMREPPARPVNLLLPQGRSSVPKVRAFLDFAVPRLRAEFARLSAEAMALKS